MRLKIKQRSENFAFTVRPLDNVTLFVSLYHEICLKMACMLEY